MFLKKELAEIKGIVEQGDVIAPKVSAKGTYWHADHTLKVISSIFLALEKSDPAAYKWAFNLSRLYIYILGSIPRGVGRAPRSVQPQDDISQEDLLQELSKAEALMVRLESLHPNSFFKHPYFGNLNLKNTRWFLKIHTRHHLKIIRDILELADS
jgi:hypothetical protein